MLSSREFLGDFFRFQFRAFGHALFELVDGPGRVNQVLFAGVEGMAIVANFNMQLLLGRAGGEGVAAGANDFGISEILWVESVFHNSQILAYSQE